MTVRLITGDVIEQLRTLPDASVQCCVTSPPYFGLRNYQVDGQIGLERTLQEYVAKMVEVFREVRRVLRNDACLWLNLGDSYASMGRTGRDESPGVGAKQAIGRIERDVVWHAGDGSKFQWTLPGGIKPKDLCGIPWRVAFALQDDGWWLRSDIIWAKPNPMPESVTDRPTKAHEYVFLLTKSARYFYDAEAIKEPMQDVTYWRLTQPNFENQTGGPKDPQNGNRSHRKTLNNQHERLICQEKWKSRFEGYEEWKKTNHGRNARTVWTITTQPYPEAHFATFPEELPRRCIKAGTSAHGCCPECGALWQRVVEKGESMWEQRKADGAPMRKGMSIEGLLEERKLSGARLAAWKAEHPDTFVGWRPTCNHDAEPIPCTVLDPFSGVGTVALVAIELGRDAIGIDLKQAYNDMARARITKKYPLLAEVI